MSHIHGFGGTGFPKEEKMDEDKVSKKRGFGGRDIIVARSKTKKKESQSLSQSKSSLVGIERNEKDVAKTVGTLLEEVERQNSLKKPGELVGVFLNKAGDKYNVKTFQVSDKDQQAEVMKRVTNANLFKLVSTVKDESLKDDLKQHIDTVFHDIGQIKEDRTDALQQVLYSSFDLEAKPPSMEALLAEPEQQYLKTLLKNNLGAVRHLVLSHPELLRRKDINPEFLNDKELMLSVLQKDPSCVLLVGDTLKKDTSVYARLLLTSLASFALGKHSKEIQSTQKEVEKIAEQFFPQKGISLSEVSYDFILLTESGFGARLSLGRISTQEQQEKAAKGLAGACEKMSYKHWKTGINKIQSGQCDGIEALMLIGAIRHPLNYKEIEQWMWRLPANIIVPILNPNDKSVARWAKENHPEFLLFMDPVIQKDSEFKATYLQTVKGFVLGTIKGFVSGDEDVGAGDASLVRDSRFPAELFQDVEFMKALKAKDQGAYDFACDEAKKLTQQR